MDEILAIINKYWGYHSLRPLQAESMQAVLDKKDSLTVLPTGAGKSLCYQAPALLQEGTTVVISPLIALMKDQVDSLRQCGIAAAQLDSTMDAEEKSELQFNLVNGGITLLFVSPERILMPEFLNTLKQIKLNSIAIDEAHCVSQWGHDFRPDYRSLGKLKKIFPDIPVHAYTATASERVREDIIEQLTLSNPLVLVGDFDRPNLTYRIIPRTSVAEQLVSVIEKHKNEAGIIYCIRRKDVDELNTILSKRGISCLPYHAGMSNEERTRNQETFMSEKVDIILATVAFGMGIDRSNIRYIVHTGMPKSIEHYQQETGRAGRDGLEAECILLYSGSDAIIWKKLLGEPDETAANMDFLSTSYTHIEEMGKYCRMSVCRHKFLKNYFGQEYGKDNCGACDVCLDEKTFVEDSQTLARKIISGVVRVGERFGVGHVTSMLRGENLSKLRDLGHDKLSTFGLLKENSKEEIQDWIYQLVSQNLLVQEGSPYPILKLHANSKAVLKGELPVSLIASPKEKESSSKKTNLESWEGVDTNLFETLRIFRKNLAAARGVPPFVILGDVTLRELSRVRPSDENKLRLIYGIGEQKLKDFGIQILSIIRKYCEENNMQQDIVVSNKKLVEKKPTTLNESRSRAFELFRDNKTIETVASDLGRAKGTVLEYLTDYIEREKPTDISAYVSDANYAKIHKAIEEVGVERLKPIYLALEEKISYDEIRIVVVHLKGKM
jgi:ATP-dependent DNA helicase RecQ